MCFLNYYDYPSLSIYTADGHFALIYTTRELLCGNRYFVPVYGRGGGAKKLFEALCCFMVFSIHGKKVCTLVNTDGEPEIRKSGTPNR